METPSADLRFMPIALHISLQAWAAIGNEAHVVQLLLSGAPANIARRANDLTYSSPLHAAARIGHPGIVRRLIEAGAIVDDLDGNGNTPLRIWAQGAVYTKPVDPEGYHAGDEEYVQTGAALLQAGADPDIKPNAVLSVREWLADEGEMHWLDQSLALVLREHLNEETPQGSAEGSSRRL